MKLDEGDVPIGSIAQRGDLIFAPPSAYHRFGRVITVTATHVTYRSIPAEREVAIPAEWLASWHGTEKGRCLVVRDQ